MPSDWLTDQRRRLAAARILDAAEGLFATADVEAVTMADIAAAAQCSRATLYRYYPSRDELLSDYIALVTARIVASVAAKTADLRPRREQVRMSVVHTLAAVREDPTLGPWFRLEAGLPARIAISHGAIAAALDGFLADGEGSPDTAATARWLARTIVGLITVPEPDEQAELAYIDRFVVPTLLGAFDRHDEAAPSESQRLTAPR